MSSKNAGKYVAVTLVWLVLLGVAAVAYKLVLSPWIEKKRIDDTSATPDFDAGRTLRLGIDSFSGYAVFRSETFRTQLAAEGLALELVDDGADYTRRLESLRRGEVQLALFTVDALIKTSAALGELPATVVMVVDETRGADAMVAAADSVPNVDALNRPDARIVLTPDSPSETLARVVMAHFQLPKLDPKVSFQRADGAADVLRSLETASPGAPRAYVLWEPYVTRALERPGVHVLVDSSSFKGYIVDVLVCQRDFLLKNEAAVESFVKAYLRSFYDHQRRPAGMVELVEADARALGDPLTRAQAEKLVEGIWWKNTQENYAHLGVIPLAERRGLEYLATIISKITLVLKKTGAVASDPTGGKATALFYDTIFERLVATDFFPGVVVDGGGESIRQDGDLAEINEAQWSRLTPVGTLQVDALVFARGTARLTELSKGALKSLARTLRDWPRYYLEIRGHARSEGDPEANRRLAEERAKAAADFLIAEGIPGGRLRAMSTPPSASGGEAQTVSFIVGQVPY